MSDSTSNPQPAQEPSAIERARALLDNGAFANFTVESHEEVPELDAEAYVMRHASGARLLFLPCEDENKAFAIAFKTPPADSTGVFHILEHSVLCGSERYPVKEPFVDLIKGSMQTFLNAMTYPDKTVYPVASTNEQDLMNLTSVYMDAVLNPAIYTKPTIFEQEGWHLELDVPEGAPLREGALRYNGVVYNEMKGALSDPMSVLDDAVAAALFPDTPYAQESGGDPKHIPELTYEQFLDTHARHYNLANSYITLYGDLHADRMLAFLDEEFLSKPNAATRRGAGAPNPLPRQEPVVCDYKRLEMTTAPENAMVGSAFVLGDALDRKRLLAADILFDAILGTNEAPLKKALLAANLGGNVVSYTAGDVAQPYELIMLQGAHRDSARAFQQVILDECTRLVRDGIPRERLEAVIAGEEYALRQRDYGSPDGVAVACDALATWLYSDDAACATLHYGPIYRELREALGTSYFEELLDELVCGSSHHALVELVPVQDSPDAPADEELAQMMERMSDEELERVAADEAELRRCQEEPDSPEALATLPRLHISDIGEPRPEPTLTVDTTAPIPCLKHQIPTHRLAYALTYFDISHVSYQELPYVSILARVMQRLGTDTKSAEELDSYIGSNLGFLSFRCEVARQPNYKLARPMLTVAAGALSEKVDMLATIPAEVWGHTVFEDADRIRDILTQARIGLEQGFLNNGHVCALRRAKSYVSPGSVLLEQLAGVDFYRFLKELLDHYDERKEELCAKLAELAGRIFTSSGTVTSFTGSEADYARYWECADGLGLSPRTAPAKELYVPMPEPKREAFVIPSDVCYVARATDPRALDIATNGSWAAVSQALSYEYLWNEVRVKGGAYGCGFRAQKDNELSFYTYRDPAIDPSLERIDAAGSWLSSYDPAPEAFESLIVSCAASYNAPLKPYALARRQDADWLCRLAPDDRQKTRAELIATTPEDLRALGDEVARVAKEAPLCVFGGREIIEASHADLNVVDLMG